MKEKSKTNGVLYWKYDGPMDFQSLIRMHLTREVQDWGKKWGNTPSKNETENKENKVIPQKTYICYR